MKLKGKYGGIGFGNVGGDRYFFSINVSNQYQVYYPSHRWFSCYKGASQPQPGQPQALCPTNDYSPDQTTRLQVVIRENDVSFYINGKLNWLGPNLGISSPGTVFFSAGYFQINADNTFQNLKIWQL